MNKRKLTFNEYNYQDDYAIPILHTPFIITFSFRKSNQEIISKFKASNPKASIEDFWLEKLIEDEIKPFVLNLINSSMSSSRGTSKDFLIRRFLSILWC